MHTDKQKVAYYNGKKTGKDMGMEAQETKFSFVYHEVKQRILTNQIPPGDYIPSSRILCHQFNVSRYPFSSRLSLSLQKRRCGSDKLERPTLEAYAEDTGELCYARRRKTER